MVRIRNHELPQLPTPTAEDRMAALETLERLRRWREEVLAARGGRYFTSAADLIRELREEEDHD